MQSWQAFPNLTEDMFDLQKTTSVSKTLQNI